MLKVTRFIPFYLFGLILLPMTVRAMATEGELVNLEWQLPGDWSASKKTSIRFKAQVTQNLNYRYSQNYTPFSGKVTVTGKAGQPFIVCAHSVVSDGFVQMSVDAESHHLHTLSLIKNAGQLMIAGGISCPNWLVPQYPYDMGLVVRSNEPFLVVRRKNGAHHNDKDLSALPPDPFASKQTSTVSLSGAGSGLDDDNDFKRPPFMPVPDKIAANLILLPILNIPANWRELLSSAGLPFTGLYHWLTDQPEEQTGLTLLVRFDGYPPITLRISQAEYPEMAEHLLNARQLLRWLAPKLNGREAFTQQLMEMADVISDTLPFWDMETLSEIQRQLMIVLEQPDTEFSLEFESHLLDGTLSVWNQAGSPKTGIIQLPKSKTGGHSGQLPAGQETKQSSGKEQVANRQPNQAGRKEQRNNDEGSREPGQPSDTEPVSESGIYMADGYFVIVVNGVQFHIKKEQLSPSQRGQEEASSIKVHKPENPAGSLPLNEVEAAVGVQEQSRLSKFNSSPLDYLLAYGTIETKNALQSYYPVNLISEREGHLVANVDYREYPVDQECEICNQPLLSRLSMTSCHHPSSKHAFHTGCLSQWFGRKHPEVWCPYCQEDLSLPLAALLSKELESELLHAIKSNNRAVVKALLETKINVDVTDENGNTALWLACSNHQLEMVELLLEKNADAHQTGLEGMSLLDAAVLTSPRHNYPEGTISLLLEKNVMMTERGVAGIDGLINTSLRRVLMLRYRQPPPEATVLNSEQQPSQNHKMENLQCFMCSSEENVSTVNGLPVCGDCLQQQAEQTAMYEDLRQPEQKE